MGHVANQILSLARLSSVTCGCKLSFTTYYHNILLSKFLSHDAEQSGISGWLLFPCSRTAYNFVIRHRSTPPLNFISTPVIREEIPSSFDTPMFDGIHPVMRRTLSNLAGTFIKSMKLYVRLH